MIVFPGCKINLGLIIRSKRADGFHNIETVFYPVGLKDILEITQTKNGQTSLVVSGNQLDSATTDNIVSKAYNLLAEKYQLPFVDIFLHKLIPSGAGLGGGSADGAYTLMLLNDLFELKLSQLQLEEYAGILGSDCPFFIGNKPVLAQEKGNVFSPVEVNLKGMHIVIVKPDLHVSTALAYAGVKPNPGADSLHEIIELPMNQWRDKLLNQFEDTVCKEFAEILEIKEILYQSGAVYASMSGSGSSVYGLFTEKPMIDALAFPAGSFIWKGVLD